MAGVLQSLSRIVERNPQQAVGGEDLRTWTFYAAVQIGVTISVPFFVFGGQLGQHQAFATLAEGIAVGALIGAAWSAVTGYVGVRARVPTAILIRRTFGSAGSKGITVLMLLISFGWFGLQTEMLSGSVNGILRASFGRGVDPLALTVLVGALISSTAMIGYRALGKLSYVSVPLLLAAVLFPLVLGLRRHGLGPVLGFKPSGAPFSLGMVISVVAGADMFGSALNPDLTRFLRTPRDNAVAMIVSMALGFPLLLLLAAALSLVWGTTDLVRIMVGSGAALPGLLVVVLATWTSNDRNLYGCGLALSAMLPKMDRWALAMIAGALGTALAAAHIMGAFLDWLTFLGILVAPMAGVYVVDFFLDRAEYAADHQDPPLRMGPLACWGFGLFVGVATLPASAKGLGLFQLTTVPTADALLAGGLAQAALVLASRLRHGPASRPAPGRPV